MVSRRLQGGPVFQNDPEDRLHSVLGDRYDRRRSSSIIGAVINLQTHEPSLHDRADGNGSRRRGNRSGVRLAGVRLRALVGALGLAQLPAGRVHVVVPLGGALDAVHGVQAGVEPLRGVGRGHLPGQAVAQLVVEGLGVGVGVEVAVAPAPVRPGVGQAVEHLPGVGLAACAAEPSAVCPAGCGTPVLRKYFWARMSAAICDQPEGTVTPSWRKTSRPSGLRISETRGSKAQALVRASARLGETALNLHGPLPGTRMPKVLYCRGAMQAVTQSRTFLHSTTRPPSRPASRRSVGASRSKAGSNPPPPAAQVGVRARTPPGEGALQALRR